MPKIFGYDLGKAYDNATTRAGNVFAAGGGNLDALGAFFTPNRTVEGKALHSTLPTLPQQQQYNIFGKDPNLKTSTTTTPTTKPTTKKTSGVGSAGVTSGGGGGGVGSGAVSSTTSNTPMTLSMPTSAYGPSPADNLGGNAPSQLDLIEQAYQTEIGALGEQESLANSQFGQTQGLLSGQREGVLGQISAEEANRRGSVESSAVNARKNLQTSYDQAAVNIAQQNAQQEQMLRQLLGDLQQRQIAGMSVAGNFNSSVRDAANESYGRQATQGATQIATGRQEAEQDINNQLVRGTGEIEAQKAAEIGKITDYYAKTRNDINNTYNSSMLQLAQQRDQRLAAIAQARGASASAKAQNTAQAWNDYLAQKRTVDMQAYENAQALDMWKQQKEFSLQQAAAYNAQQIQAGSVSAPKAQYSFTTDAYGKPTYRTNKYTGEVEAVSAGGGAGGGGEEALQVASGLDPAIRSRIDSILDEEE